MNKTVTKVIDTLCLPQALDFWCKQFKINYQSFTPTVKVVGKSVMGDVVKLVLKPSKAFGKFIAGQHVRLKLEIGGIGHERCYSIANLPTKSGLVELYVKVQGNVSKAIKQQLKKGAVLDISKPFGNNHKQQFELFVAGGIGITAIWPLFKAQNGTNKKLVYLTRLNEETASAPLLTEIRASKFYKDGLVTIADGRTFLSEPSCFSNLTENVEKAIACGSEGFNNKVETSLNEAFDAVELTREDFKATQVHSPGYVKNDIKVKLIHSDRMLVVDNKTTLLDSLLNAGIKAKHGCKQGICHECTCRVSAASLLNDVNKTIQLCTTFPNSDLELEL